MNIQPTFNENTEMSISIEALIINCKKDDNSKHIEVNELTISGNSIGVINALNELLTTAATDNANQS